MCKWLTEKDLQIRLVQRLDLCDHPQQRDEHRWFCFRLLQRPNLRDHRQQCDAEWGI